MRKAKLKEEEGGKKAHNKELLERLAAGDKTTAHIVAQRHLQQ